MGNMGNKCFKQNRELKELISVQIEGSNEFAEVIDSIYVCNIKNKNMYRIDGSRSIIRRYLTGNLLLGDEVLFGRDFVKREPKLKRLGIKVERVISLL